MVDAVDILGSSLFSMELVLADFLRSLESKKAHWFRVLEPDENDPNRRLIQSTFPSVASLMSMNQNIYAKLLFSLGLVRKKTVRGVVHHIACSNSWTMFIARHLLGMEVTTTTLAKKTSSFPSNRLMGWHEAYIYNSHQDMDEGSTVFCAKMADLFLINLGISC
jgi:hypothetical protein